MTDPNSIRSSAREYNAAYGDVVSEIVDRGEVCISVSVTNPRASRTSSGTKFVVSALAGVYVAGIGFAAAADTPAVKVFSRRPSHKAVENFARSAFGNHPIRHPRK